MSMMAPLIDGLGAPRGGREGMSGSFLVAAPAPEEPMSSLRIRRRLPISPRARGRNGSRVRPAATS